MKKIFLVAMAIVLISTVAIAADITESVYVVEKAKATESNSLENAVSDCRELKKDLNEWLARMVKYNTALGTYTDADFKNGLISFYQAVNTFNNSLASNYPVILTGDDGVE